ncbi:UV radiation resistance protein and autophagy-related subunit 14-domain-containing protein [Crucibulum laeve]|uniref:Autophagy-related protein 14 n=1 Tax=Crucibulum laeve TaxID=68775 RepID=A0A5C3M8H6_9AGAR|nr:UV radiation resistance protein and autophagy-related subunit 14-domain-containing protein [Crucibulum laeve]
MEPPRIARAQLADYSSRVDELMSGLAKLRKENDKKRDRLQTLRETLASRRRTISAAKLVPVQSASNQANIMRESQELASFSSTIARARSGLVGELVDVFNVVEVGGRPPIGGKAGTKGEWTIGDLILPVPGDIRRYPPEHINAVLRHTLHFLHLLTFYLGIKLPFDVSWSGGKFGVGQAWIRATSGGEAGGWAKWQTQQPLHLSASPESPTPPLESTPAHPNIIRSASERPRSGFSGQRTASVPTSLQGPTTNAASSSQSQSQTLQASLVDSYMDDTTSSSPPTSSFTTAFAMLIYDVCYLAYTQAIDIPLSQAGDVLSNLWLICCSAELGRKSHETSPFLPPPTPTSFQLDFAQLLQATSANPVRKPHRLSQPMRVNSMGAELKPRRTQTAPVSANDARRREREREIIMEEEDGWDLIGEDDGLE